MITGLILLIITGSSWVIIGAVVGKAGKAGISVGIFQMLSSLGIIAAALVLSAFRPWPECGALVFGATMLSLFGSGFLNYFVLNLMGRAMKSGPNGIVWSVIQSALIFPFLVGVIFFGVPLTGIRLGGMIAILTALILLGSARGNRYAGGDNSWRWAMFASFLLAGINQNLASLPSYFPSAAGVDGVFRSMSSAAGTIAAFGMTSFRLLAGAEFRRQLRIALLWKMLAVQLLVGIVTGFFLMYRGFDLLAEAGLGAINYPVLICSCLVSFTLYSRLILKERFTATQWSGLFCAIAGIILISLK